MFKIVLIFLTIIFYKILTISSIQESLKQSPLLTKVGYNIIYFYSICQIKCNQLYNNFLPYLEMFKNENKLIDDIKNQTLELFDLSTNKNKNITDNEQQIFNQMVLSIRSPNNILIMSELLNQKYIHKKIINKKTWNFDFDVSKITFIALYLNYNDARYNININNILKLPFNYEKEDMLSYQLELMDHEVNMISLNACQSIIIEKDSYQILNETNINIDNVDLVIVNDLVEKEKVE